MTPRCWRYLLPLFMLAGCSASQCDPNNAGLFTGIGCSAGSGYADRTNTLTTEADSAKAQSQQAYQGAIAAQQSDYQANAQVKALRAQLSAMNQQVNADQANLASLHASNAAQAAKVAAVQKEIDQLQSQIASQQSQPSPQEVQRLQQKHQQEERDLLNLSSQM
jgi:hypothetical protein